MAFDAGAVKGRAILDDSQWVKGSKNVAKSTGGMTKSIFAGQLAFAAFNKAVTVVVNTVKQSITAFAKQQQVEKQLETVLKSTKNAVGLTATEIKNMAGNLQQMTTFGDEAILSGQNLLLTFTKIGKDVFPSATETMLNMSQALGQNLQQSAIQLGKALQDPIQGVTALRRVGIQLSTAQTEQIKRFVELNDIASAQKVILGELETQFGGSAAAARDTFGGALKSLKNIQGDLLESIGAYVEIIGRDFVEAQIEATGAVKDFLSDQERMNKFAATMETLRVIFADFGTILKESVVKVVETFRDRFGELFGRIKESISPIEILGGILTKVSQALVVGANIVVFYINAYANLIEIIKRSALVLKSFWDSVKEGNFQPTIDAVANVSKGIEKLTKDVTTDVSNVIDSAVDLWNPFNDAAKTNIDKYNKVWEEANNKIQEVNEETTQSLEEENDKRTSNLEKTAKEMSRILSLTVGDSKEELDKQSKEIGKTFADVMTSVLNVIADAVSNVFDLITGFFDQELDQLKIKHEAELEELEMQKERKLEQTNNAFDEQVESLEIARQNEIITEEEFNERLKLIEDQRAETTAQIEEDLSKKQIETRKKQLAKENEIEKKKFIAEKANKIAEIWIQAALGIVAAWTGSFQALAGIPIVGPALATAMAAVMTALILGTSIASTVLVGQQQFIPKKAKGGIGSGLTEINEGDRGEIVNLPDGSLVIPNDISQQIARNVGTTRNGNMINVSFKGAMISDKMSLRAISQQVIRDMGRQLREAT
jgi:hypothetical protein